MRISRLVDAGRLRKLGPKVYTSAVGADPAAVARRNWFTIAGYLFPNSVVSRRNALEHGPSSDGTVCLTWDGPTKTIDSYPGLVFRVFKGRGPIEGDYPFNAGLHVSSRPRALLENLIPSRSIDGRVPATLGQKQIEELLDRDARIHGLARLHDHLAKAKPIAEKLGLHKEYDQLATIIGYFKSENASGALSDVVRARSSGLSYNAESFARYETLREFLARVDFPPMTDPAPGGEAWRNFSFIEAYFSNFIEGTEFEVDEAYQIVFEGRIPVERPRDARDVLGTFRVVSDDIGMSRSIRDASEFLDVLKSRHYEVMASRPEMRPGEFKTVTNRAGSTQFVEPERVPGTLIKGFQLLETLTNPMARALFVKYLTVDVHPFLDGNGRTARIMMNAELVKAGEARIIVPSVYRDNYINAVARLRRENDPLPYVRAMEFARTFSASLDYSDYGLLVQQLEQARAFSKPSETRLILPRNVRFESATDAISTTARSPL